MKRKLWRVLLLCSWGILLQAQAATVAVMRFKTHHNDVSLEWAQLGIPDLLMAELSASGWQVVDRESIEHVLGEQALDDNVRAGQLVGAEYVISGAVSCPEPGRIAIEAALTGVQSFSTVNMGLQSGLCPQELGELIRRLADKLTDAKLDGTAGHARPEGKWFPKPEAVIFFYRGLSAFTAGYPEAALPWFITASRMDTKFVLARAWEIRTYETMGLPDLAGRARETRGSRITAAPFPESGEARTIAVARPILTPAGEWPGAQIGELMQAVSAGLAKCGRIGLINPDALEMAIREQDFQLGGFMGGGATARYGEWQIPDGILQSRIESQGSDLSVQIWIDSPGHAGAVIQETGVVARADIMTGIPRLLGQMLAHWQEASATPAPPGGYSEVRPMPADLLAGLSEKYMPLALALHQLRQHEGYDEWRALVDAFRQAGFNPMAGAALDQAIKHMDLNAANADCVLYHLWHDFKDEPGGPWDLSYYATPSLIASLQSNLLARFPDSVCTAALWYENGWKAWNMQRYAEAAGGMRDALARFPPGRFADENEAVAAAKFILADSLKREGKPEEAAALFGELSQFLKQNPGRGDSVPTTLQIDDECQIAGDKWRDLQTRARVRNAIRNRTGWGKNIKQTNAVDAVKAQINQNGNFQGAPNPEAIMPALDAVIEAWRTVGPFDVLGESDLNIVRLLLFQMARSIGEPERRDWFPKFTEAYLQRMRAGTADLKGEAKLEAIAPHFRALWQFYDLACLHQAGLDFLDQFLAPNVPRELSFCVLAQADLTIEELRFRIDKLVAELPGGERDVPGELWSKLALQYADIQEWEKAGQALRKGFASAQPAKPADETARIIIHKAFAARPDDPYAAVKVACEELALQPWLPRWWQWYNEGCRSAATGNHELAIACFQVVLRFLDSPGEMDPDIHIEPSKWGPPRLHQYDILDSSWTSDLVSRRNSARFRLALSFLARHQPDQAAAYLRPVALEVGQDQVPLFFEIKANGFACNRVKLGMMASAMLHCLHLLNEIQGTDMPMPDCNEVIRQCRRASRELKSVRCVNEAGYFSDAVKRLKALKRTEPIFKNGTPGKPAQDHNAVGASVLLGRARIDFPVKHRNAVRGGL